MELRTCYAVLFLLASEMGLKLPESEALEDDKDHFSSTFDLRCTEFNRNYAYCWCNTLAGWDYCSFADSRTYEDKACKSGHTCGKHGKAYSWCHTNDKKWGYCGRVAAKANPKDVGPVVSHMTPTYVSCLNECGRGMGKAYFWCYTAKGWDVCSPLPKASPSNVPCRGDFPCGLYGKAYYWCYTTGSDWDYCGPIKDAECGYKETDSWKSSDSEPQLMCRESTDTRTVHTQFVTEPAAAWTDGYNYYHEVTVELTPNWNRTFLTDQTLPVMLRSENLNLTLTEMLVIEKDRYHCYQIQVVNRQGPSAPIAQVLIPENKNVPERYIRRAFADSLLRKAGIRISIVEY